MILCNQDVRLLYIMPTPLFVDVAWVLFKMQSLYRSRPDVLEIARHSNETEGSPQPLLRENSQSGIVFLSVGILNWELLHAALSKNSHVFLFHFGFSLPTSKYF